MKTYFDLVDPNISAEIVEWTHNTATRHELISIVITAPRFLLAQLNTYGSAAKNAASSRAIPTAKILARVETPVLPSVVLANKAGMQGEIEVDEDLKQSFYDDIRILAKHAAAFARTYDKKVHKQHVNRFLEPFITVKQLMTMDLSGWGNLLAQRRHQDAQPEFQILASEILRAMKAGKKHRRSIVPLDYAIFVRGKNLNDVVVSRMLDHQPWMHLPFVTAAENAAIKDAVDVVTLSVARCARVSYWNDDSSMHLNLEDAQRMVREKLLHSDSNSPRHMSPFEHVALPIEWHGAGKFKGFVQLRKFIIDERASFPFAEHGLHGCDEANRE